MLEVEFLLAFEQGFADRVVDEVGGERGEDHQDAHGEDPDDQLAAHGRICGQRQGQKGDQGHAGDAVGLEAVRRGADAVTRIVARAVGDDAGVFRIVFGQMEDDLHQVGTDVGDLGEDTAADPQRAGAEGFADGKPDEAGAGQLLRNVGENQDHEEELDAHQQETDAHPGAKADVHHDSEDCRSGRRRPPGNWPRC